MATRKAMAAECDAPSCLTRNFYFADIDEWPEGLIMRVQVHLNGLGDTVDVYACSLEHAEPAIRAVLNKDRD